MNNLLALTACFIVGFSVFIGSIIVFKSKRKDKLLDFAISLAFSVLLTLGFIEILPEALELMQTHYNKTYAFIIVFVLCLIGILILKILDRFVPDHSNHAKEDNKTLVHIALITTLAVFMHNIIEGMALFSAFIISIKTGLVFSLGIFFHNIALGLAITSELMSSTNDKSKTLKLILILALSTFVGSVLMAIFDFVLINEVIEGIILAITLGMILYIVFFELLSLFINTKDKKLSTIGCVLGIILMILTTLI